MYSFFNFENKNTENSVSVDSIQFDQHMQAKFDPFNMEKSELNMNYNHAIFQTNFSTLSTLSTQEDSVSNLFKKDAKENESDLFCRKQSFSERFSGSQTFENKELNMEKNQSKNNDSSTWSNFSEKLSKIKSESPLKPKKANKKIKVSEMKTEFFKNKIAKIAKKNYSTFKKDNFAKNLKTIINEIFISGDEKWFLNVSKTESVYVEIILTILVTGFLGEKNKNDLKLFEMNDSEAVLHKKKILQKPDEIRKRFFRKFFDYLMDDEEFKKFIENFIKKMQQKEANFYNACSKKPKMYLIALFRYLFEELDHVDFNSKVLFKIFKETSYEKFINDPKKKKKPGNLTNKIYKKILNDKFLQKKFLEFSGDNRNFILTDASSIAEKILDCLPKKETFSFKDLENTLYKNINKIKRCHEIPNFILLEYARQFISDIKSDDSNYKISQAKQFKC